MNTQNIRFLIPVCSSLWQNPWIGKVDAVYIPTDNLLAEGMSTVTMITNANNLPCIVGEEGMVTNGGLATYGIDYYALGQACRQAGC